MERWGGWPEAFADGVDFAFYGTGSHAEHIYFFRGDEYIRYNLPRDRVELGPEKVAVAWPTMSRFMPVPQLFLVEQYDLTTFHGEMGNGGVIDVPVRVAPGASSKFKVVTKIRESISVSTSRNILESSHEQVANNFSDSLRTDQSASENRQNYDYSMDASFHGDVSVVPGGGEANADVKVKGATQDLRRSFARAVGSQVRRQATETRELHAEQIRRTDEKHAIDKQTETEFFQEIHNTSDRAVNVVLFQLTQEYILVLSLVDARLAFRNGNEREARSVPVKDMATLLDACVQDPTARRHAARGVVVALSSTLDHTGAERSLLAPGATPDGAVVDPTIKTSFPVHNSAGALMRSIVVDGIVVDVQRPVVLTPNAALDVLHVSG